MNAVTVPAQMKSYERARADVKAGLIFEFENADALKAYCSAGKVLIGAQAIASYARASLSSGGDAGESQAAIPVQLLKSPAMTGTARK